MAARMQFHFRQMTAPDARAIATWHYPVPYDFYDWDRDADDLAELLDPRSWQQWYYAALDTTGALVGFLSLREADGTVEIGLGLRPDLTGNGHGLAFMLACLDYARARYTPVCFRLAVATFNVRAIRVYERAGFAPGRVYQHVTNGGRHEFMEMILVV